MAEIDTPSSVHDQSKDYRGSSKALKVHSIQTEACDSPVLTGEHEYAGGGVTSDETATGVVATDKIIATLKASTDVVAVGAVAGVDKITFNFSADPGAGTVIAYQVLRAAS